MSALIRTFLRLNKRMVFYCPIQCLQSTQFWNNFQNDLTRIRFENNILNVRYKSKSKKAKQEVVTTDDNENTENDIDDFEKELVDKNTKIVQVKVSSLRADVVLKSGLGMSRNKVEEMFYESKIRVNGAKIFKKSEILNEGDEVDVVKGTDINNPSFLMVARIEILSVVPKGEGLLVKLRRCKNLTIENYEDPWKPK